MSSLERAALAEPSSGRPGAIGARLTATARFVAAHQELWRPRPFLDLPLPWEAHHPRLSAWLRQLDQRGLDFLERQTVPALPAELAGWGTQARALARVRRLPFLKATSSPASARRRRVSALKLAAVDRFVDALAAFIPPADPVSRTAAPDRLRGPAGGGVEFVDWCAGKGHLARALRLRFERPVVAYELDPALCRAGLAFGAADETLRIVQADVRRWGCGLGPLDATRWPTALHACGHLSDALIERATADGAAGVGIAPCCPHRIGPTGTPSPRLWQPLTRTGRRELPVLSSSDLRLASAEDVRSPGARRQRSLAWRLGLDLLVREASGESVQRPLRNLPRSLFNQPFATFCRSVAQRQHWPLPARWSEARAEAAAWERARLVRALALVRAQFRRPLELAVWLDRAQFLEQAGLEVKLGSFCERALTPRNILILARRT